MRLSMFGAALAVAAMSLAACNTVTPVLTAPPGGAVAPPSGSTAISAAAQKGLYGLEATYNTAAHVYLAAEPSMTPEVKAKRKAQLQALYKALLTARHAATLADSAGVLAAVGPARTMIDADPSIVREN